MDNGTDRFDQVAATWDADASRAALAEAVADGIMRSVGSTPAMDVLDFGCGTGLLTLALAPHVRHIVGADASAGMLAVLEEKIRSKHLLSVRPYLVGNARPLASAGRFHLITSSMALHHVRDVPALIAEFATLLHPHGRLALADLDSEDGTFHDADVRDVHHRGFDRAWLRERMLQHGFVDVRDTTAFVHRRRGREYPVFLMTAEWPGRDASGVVFRSGK
jgi:tRNA (cmo5U34)-methyltransferase